MKNTTCCTGSPAGRAVRPRSFLAITGLAALAALLGAAPERAAAQTCTLTHGYWKNHTSAWKLTSLTLGTQSYSAAQALAILQQPAGGDASKILADQLIAALLNIAGGAAEPKQVAAAIADANKALGSSLIPEAVQTSTPLGQQMVNDATVLDNYNNGQFGGSCSTTPIIPVGSCQPSSSLSVLVQGSNVTAYVPKGSWESTATGVSVVNVEGSSIAPAHISTPAAVNSCASNPITGTTVCSANTSDVYLLNGTSLSTTLVSGGSGDICFSGGCATNTGVAMDAVHNKALLGVSVAGKPGFQFLDLGTSSFEPPFASPATRISEDPLIDPTRNTLGLNTSTGNAAGALLLSASENGNYEIVDVTSSTAPVSFEHPTGGGELDSSGEDCQTGIALSPAEFSGPSSVFIADLTQATYTTGTPGTWSVPAGASQNQILSESFLAAGASGIAVAQGTHTGVVTGEFGGSALTAIALPATSGSGTPAITDWVTCSIAGFSFGTDPHTVTAYKSPASADAIGVFANGGATSVAVVDLTKLLNSTLVPRDAGGHACAGGTIPSSIVTLIAVP